MIDEKEIEEAAIENSEKLSDGKHYRDLVVGFKDGVRWAINEFLKNLWHSADEEPEKFRKILYTGGSIDTTDTTMLIINNSWNTKVCLLKIKKWCYIDDLFQNGGGNYD